MKNTNELKGSLRSLKFFMYPLILLCLLIGMVFASNRWLPDSIREELVSSTGVTEQFLYLVGIVFLLLSLSLYGGISNLQATTEITATLRLVFDLVSKLVNGLLRLTRAFERFTEGKQTQLDQYKPEVDLRGDLEGLLTQRIQEAESRLRSEWRFVVALIVTTLLALVALFGK